MIGLETFTLVARPQFGRSRSPSNARSRTSSPVLGPAPGASAALAAARTNLLPFDPSQVRRPATDCSSGQLSSSCLPVPMLSSTGQLSNVSSEARATGRVGESRHVTFSAVSLEEALAPEGPPQVDVSAALVSVRGTRTAGFADRARSVAPTFGPRSAQALARALAPHPREADEAGTRQSSDSHGSLDDLRFSF